MLCSRDSFLNLSRRLADARALASPHLVVVLVRKSWIKMRTGRWNGRQADGQPSLVRAVLIPVDSSLITTDVPFLETSSLTGNNVESPFLLAARSIRLSIESGALGV